MVDPPPILLRGPAAFCELHQPFAPDIAPPATLSTENAVICGRRFRLRISNGIKSLTLSGVTACHQVDCRDVNDPPLLSWDQACVQFLNPLRKSPIDRHVYQRLQISAPFSRRNLSASSVFMPVGMAQKFTTPIGPVGRNPHS